MNTASHTVGEVVNTVMTLCTPADPHDIHIGRAHDGLKINLHPRSLCDRWQEDITEPTLLMIRALVSRHQGRPGMDVASALEFIDSVRVAPAQPGVIGQWGRVMLERMKTLFSSGKSGTAAEVTPAANTATEPEFVGPDVA